MGFTTRLLTMTCSLILSPLLLPAASGNVFDKDDRVSVKPLVGDPFAAIGNLYSSRHDGRGTAFLVGRCLVLTNLHVAFTSELSPDMNEISQFILPTGEGANATPVAHGDFSKLTRSHDDREDWALLHLDDCLGDKYGWLNLKSVNKPRSTIAVVSAGFPNDRVTDTLAVDPICYILGPLWEHNCASRPGSSGSPIMIKNTDGSYDVIAIHSRAHGDFPEIVRGFDLFISNGAVPVSGFIERIRPYLERER